MKKKLSFPFFAAILGLGAGLAIAGCDNFNLPTSKSEEEHTSQVESNPVQSSKSEEPTPSESKQSESVAEHVHTWGQPTWEWTQSGETFTVKGKFVCTADSTHVETVEAQVNKGDIKAPTCTEAGSVTFTATVTHDGASFTDTKTESVKALGHDIVHHDAKAATCTEAGWEAYDTCSRCNYTTYKEIKALGHEFSTEWKTNETQHWHECKHGCGEVSDKANHVLKTREVVTDPTCTLEGSKKVETYCEVCGLVTEVQVTKIDKVAHKFALDAEHSTDATCTTRGVKVYKCEMCDETYREELAPLGHDYKFVSCTEPYKCSRCEATKEAPGHQYTYDAEHSQELSCSQDGITRYTCKVCGDYYEDKTPAQGHKYVGDWKFVRTEHDETTKCLDHDIFANKCSECGEIVEKGEDIYRHQYIAKIVTPATCVAKGQKQYVCKECGNVEKTEEIPISEDAHNWDAGETVGNITTFHCQNEGCTATKTSVVATEKNIEVTSADFAAVEEVQLTNAALAFDDASKSLLEGKDLKIEVKETTAGEITIREGQDVQIPADTKVYDFSITDTSDQPLAFSGEGEDSGKVTVRLPYEIQEGEDADNLIIYYVDADGNIAEFEAVYDNGFAVFETTHFSYYLVSYMTPEQACAKFNHRYGETITVEPGCLTRGYQYEVCSRCGHMEIHDEVAPLGHKFVTDETGSKNATCTEPGYNGIVCEHCHQQYGEVEPAHGHSYQQKDVVAPTCTEAGSIKYVCAECGDTYTQVIPAKGHTYEAKTTAATCKAEGKIEYVCKDCGAKDESRTIVLDKIEHNYVLDHETDDEYVYKCSYECGETKVVSKNTAPLTEENVLHKHFFTNTGKSIEGKDLSAHSGSFTFKVGEDQVSFSASESEGHIGVDSNGKLLVYASTNYNTNGQEGAVAIYLVNNKLYVKMSSPYGGDYYMVYNLEEMGSSEFSLGDLLNNVPQLVEFLNTDVKEFLDNLADYNDERINRLVYHFLDRLFTFKSTPTGYDIIIDFNKLAALNEQINTKSIAEVIDYLLGEGKTNELLEDFQQYCSLSLYDALAKIKQKYGLDYQDLLRLINKATKIVSGKETLRDVIFEASDGQVDIDEYLSEEYLKAHSINSLVKDTEWAANFLDDKTLSEFIKVNIKGYLDKNIYTLLKVDAELDEDMLNEVKEQITKYVNLLKESNSSIVLKLGENGEFQALNVVLDVKSEDVELAGDLQVYFGDGYRSVFNYDEIYRLSESVTKIVMEDRFSSDEKILKHFDEDAEVVRDADGHIVSVTETRARSQEMYYDPETGKSYTKSNTIVVESEQDLFDLAGRSYYFDIVDAYKEYASKGQMIINLGSFSTYTVSNFAPYNLSFYQVCGNKYEYQYHLQSDYEGLYDAAQVRVVDETGNVLYSNIFSNSVSRYKESGFRQNGAVDLASGKAIESGSVEHSYVLVEMSDPSTLKCGDLCKVVYVCADCGAVNDNSFIVSHSGYDSDNIVSATLVHPNSSCYEGVKVTYKCDGCGEEVTETAYEHMYLEHKEITTESGLKVEVSNCICHNSRSKIEIDGYWSYEDEKYNEFRLVKANSEEPNIEYAQCAVFYPDDYENEENPKMILVGTSSTYENCTYKSYMTIYEGVTYNQETGFFYYDAVTKDLISEGESHSQYWYVYGSLKPIDENDLSKGYTYQEKCESCGDVLTYDAVDPQSLQGLDIKLSDLGYSHTYGGYVYLIGTAEELYKLFTNKTAVLHRAEICAYGCNFDWNYNEDSLGNTWEIARCTVSDAEAQEACTFKYARCYNDFRESVGNHTRLVYSLIYLGCDEYGQNPLFTIKLRRGYENGGHDFKPDAANPAVTFDTDNENVKIIVTPLVCSECGSEASDSQLKVLEQPKEDFERVEGADGLVYEYQPGYRANLKTGGYTVYDANGRIIQSYYGEIYGGGNMEYQYYSIHGTLYTYGYYGDVQYIKSIEYITHYYNSDMLTSDGEEVAESNGKAKMVDQTSTIYYYPFEENTKYNELFKQTTGFDYDLSKYGCYTIVEDNYSDGHSNCRLKHEHIAFEASGEYHCTQENEATCKCCGKVIKTAPEGHKFVWDYTLQHYKCANCGTESYNGYNGSIILENLTDLESGKVTIGYCFKNYPSANGTSLEKLNAYIYCVVTQMNGYSLNLNQLKYTDVGDGVNGKFEFDLKQMFELMPENGINPKLVKEIAIYFEGYLKGQYYDNFYESIVFSAKELGIDTKRYFVTFTSDQLEGEVEDDAVLTIDPENMVISIQTDEGYKGGQLEEYESYYFAGRFYGDEYLAFRSTWFYDDNTGNEYYLFATTYYDEENDTYLTHYFMEVEENPFPEEEEEDEPSQPSNPSNPSQGEVGEGGQSEGGVSEGGSDGQVSEGGISEGGFPIGGVSEGAVAEGA